MSGSITSFENINHGDSVLARSYSPCVTAAVAMPLPTRIEPSCSESDKLNQGARAQATSISQLTERLTERLAEQWHCGCDNALAMISDSLTITIGFLLALGGSEPPGSPREYQNPARMEFVSH